MCSGYDNVGQKNRLMKRIMTISFTSWFLVKCVPQQGRGKDANWAGDITRLYIIPSYSRGNPRNPDEADSSGDFLGVSRGVPTQYPVI